MPTFRNFPIAFQLFAQGPGQCRTIMQSTSSAYIVHPATPSTLQGDGGGGGGGTELSGRGRWIHRVGDYFLGAPPSGLPVTTPTTDLADGDQDTTTTEEAHEDPTIRWFCGFGFKRGEDNEALVADGWRWRMQGFFLSQGFGALISLVAILGGPPRWIYTFALAYWFAFTATATVLAFFQNSSCLRRSTAATMLHVILHLVLLAVCVSVLLIDADLGAVFSTPNASSLTDDRVQQLVREFIPERLRSPQTTVVVISFDAWIRRELVTLLICLCSFFFALLLPVSRGGRWFGIVFQVTAVPAIQVRGVASGVG